MPRITTTASSAAASSAATHAPSTAPTTKECWAWQCQHCERECVPVRAQSRCLCSHRLAAHTAGSGGHGCSSCSCKGFNFIVAEGAWCLKCRCKHKATDHDAAAAPHACTKTNCSCTGFFSPWVCNCDHPWAEHTQLLVTKKVVSLQDMIAQAQAQQDAEQQQQQGSSAPAAVLTDGDLTCEVNQFHMLQRGKDKTAP